MMLKRQTFFYRERINPESQQLVQLDTNIHTNEDDSVVTLEGLRKIAYYTKLFDIVKERQQYIEQSKDTTTFLATSGHLREIPIPQSDQLKMWLHCQNKEHYQLWASKYSRTITLKNITGTTMRCFLEQLPMYQLESIVITRHKRWHDPVDIHQELWLMVLSAGRDQLRYLHLPNEIWKWDFKQLSFDLSALEPLTFDYILIDQMLVSMCHTHNLRRFKARVHGRTEEFCVPDIILSKLSHLNVNIDSR
ncbi:unnamed protein product [Didymodactylos carnosus]|uniref:Uncharacterized protein n=1 Tax=Didymodactylos carnosus TaxID=1234261 RepID=A0A8S2D588_9BILA|nr:unnamed protein product [Didymodactylos carnosus]CAF3665202.1 unnamed protein product [Didymodactylos carnosus]